MSEHYILDGHKAVPADLMTWARWFEANDRAVAKTDTPNGHVSTVFLGLNHRLTAGPPLLFETLVFDGTLDGEMERYATWDEAAAGHAQMVKKVTADAATT